MRRRRPSVLLALTLAVLVPQLVFAEDDGGVLAGRVEDAIAPLSTARVYAYALADLELQKTVTDRDGLFLFSELPAGLYKIIAFKPGFLPAVVMLSRASTGATQFLDVQLNRQSENGETAAASFWKLREEIPSDVLRDMHLPVYASAPPVERTGPQTRNAHLDAPTDQNGFQTEMQAIAGVREGLDVADAQMSGAAVDVSGQVNELKIDINGRFTELAGDDESSVSNGSTQELDLSVANAGKSTVGFSTRSNQISDDAEEENSVDFERHELSWSRAHGERARSSVSAQYTKENNFYRQALLTPELVPTSSRSWRIEGSYAQQVTDRSNVEAGLLYRQRSTDETHESMLPSETVELFGRGGWQVKPALMVQYGLYSALRDGTLSLSPHGGVVLNLSPKWKAETLASHRVDTDRDEYRRVDFTPTYYRDARSCRQAEEYCYEFSVSRSATENDSFKLGAIHRKIGETQRLFFDSDFFNRFDSLYLVDGDRLPEVKMELTRRLTPSVVTRIESNLAAGGGGVLQTSENAYENQVRYVVTSIDTRFEGTETGLFVAFHRLEQELIPLGDYDKPELALERLQVGVRQDLGFLDRLASDLAVHLNMELSRGGNTEELFEKLRKRITGGLAVKF